tara:strand:+ start:477 stop:632 length:156 start_codon:yes stop_codon:yes gene_type:complete
LRIRHPYTHITDFLVEKVDPMVGLLEGRKVDLLEGRKVDPMVGRKEDPKLN